MFSTCATFLLSAVRVVSPKELKKILVIFNFRNFFSLSSTQFQGPPFFIIGGAGPSYHPSWTGRVLSGSGGVLTGIGRVSLDQSTAADQNWSPPSTLSLV